jgi:hypothetical protein
MMTETTSDLTRIRRHYWGHEGRRKKGHEHEQASEVLQGPDESPRQFYECLCEAFCLYTPFDPEATENQQMINITFVGQAQGNIR